MGKRVVRVYTKQGSLSPDDRIIAIETDGREQVTYQAIAKILLPLMENEERLYPSSNGHRGWRKPLDFLKDAHVKGLDWALAYHQVRQSNFLDTVPERKVYHP
jgi:hypothetical protein